MVNIFEEAKEKTVPSWAKFVNAGDSVQGTYVGKIVGQKDGYGNEQIIYQLLQEDESIINVGFGLNKKVLHKDMEEVKFGQIVGFKYKGLLSVEDRRPGKKGQMVDVKDFALHYDPKIVNEKWLKENEGNMPDVTVAEPVEKSADINEAFPDTNTVQPANDVPFSSETSLTNADKLVAIEKLAIEKLGATDAKTAKVKVMEETKLAVIPLNYDKILEALAAKGF